MAERVWITRASPGAEATATRVRSLGLEAVVAPLLEVRWIGAGIDLTGVRALAFTSANAVRAFAARSPARDLPVFAVGDATAETADEAGFRQVNSADGDVAALARLIGEHRPGLLLHAGARAPAGDVVGALAALGVEARHLALYETAPTSLAAPPAANAVLLHSPRAAGVLAEMMAATPTSAFLAACLSPAVAAPLAGLGWCEIAVAPRPTEAALLSLLAARLPRSE